MSTGSVPADFLHCRWRPLPGSATVRQRRQTTGHDVSTEWGQVRRLPSSGCARSRKDQDIHNGGRRLPALHMFIQHYDKRDRHILRRVHGRVDPVQVDLNTDIRIVLRRT